MKNVSHKKKKNIQNETTALCSRGLGFERMGAKLSKTVKKNEHIETFFN